MKTILIILVVVAYVSLEPAATGSSGGGLNNPAAIHAQTNAVPIIEIESAARFGQNQPLAFQCRISNPGTEPLYIYSTLLKNRRFAEIVIDRKQKLIEFRFTRLETSPLAPYYFPQATFRELTASQSENFLVASTSAIKELRGFEIINGTSSEARITSGRWTFRIMIGYGNDVITVKRALASDPAGEKHPINEIVKWQKVAFSNSITIDVTK